MPKVHKYITTEKKIDKAQGVFVVKATLTISQEYHISLEVYKYEVEKEVEKRAQQELIWYLFGDYITAARKLKFDIKNILYQVQSGSFEPKELSDLFSPLLNPLEEILKCKEE